MKRSGDKDTMGKRRPELRLLTRKAPETERTPTPVDTAPRRSPLPHLTRAQLDALLALLAPGRGVKLPRDAGDLDARQLVEFATRCGRATMLERQASHSGLRNVAHHARHAAQRQRFATRRATESASRAAKTLSQGGVSPPLLVGSLSVSLLTNTEPLVRQDESVVFVVPPRELRRATSLLGGSPEVQVRSTALGPGSRRTLEQSVRLRGCLHAAEGWQLPTPEDSALLIIDRMQVEPSAPLLASLLDLLNVLDHPGFHWPTFAQRATVWRKRVQAHEAFRLAHGCFGDAQYADYAGLVTPTPLERLRRRLLGS